MNLVLVSRTESKLVEQEAELRAKHSIKVKHCAADLCKADDATFARLAEVLEGVDVGILVNNAGMSYDHPDYLERLSDDFLRDLITINTLAPTKVGRRTRRIAC
jgi:17beta-estradiol 17-dehydrogenase / very-long-chain 3-oxoacyl-CoA reductase